VGERADGRAEQAGERALVGMGGRAGSQPERAGARAGE
jgi:hypothetical protein